MRLNRARVTLLAAAQLGEIAPVAGVAAEIAREGRVGDAEEPRVVALQVAFESNVLKPENNVIASRLKPGAFKLWVKRIQLALPHRVLPKPPTRDFEAPKVEPPGALALAQRKRSRQAVHRRLWLTVSWQLLQTPLQGVKTLQLRGLRRSQV
jgi:hypothetical protein